MDRRAPVLVIDLLRFFAAMAVVAYHLGASAALHPTAPIHLFGGTMPDGGVRWTWSGWVGVELFFVISGYVIVRSAQGAAPAAFLRRRALRLVPAAWLCASLTAAVLVAGSSLASAVVAGRWTAALLFVPIPAMIDGSYWSLEVEWSFYLLTALALRGRGADAADGLAVRIGLASAAFLALATVVPVLGDAVATNSWLPLTLMPHGVFFGLGAVLARAAAQGWSRPTGILALLFATGGGVEITLHAHSFAALGPALGSAIVPLALFGVGVAAIACAAPLQAPLARHLGAARLQVLGLVSYPLYLLHQVIGAALVAAALDAGLPAAPAALGAAGLILLLAFAISRWVEPWLRGRLAALRLPRALAPDRLATASPPTG